MSKLIENVTRGADPELFLKDANGTPITSIGRIGGTKHFPRDIGNGFALQEDNVTVEFNIPPCSDKKRFNGSIQYMLSFIKSEISKDSLDIDISATAFFTEEQLQHPQAMELGCEPDYNAWTGKVNPRPQAPEELRSAGGHLHIGYDNPTVEKSTMLVKAHDLFISVPSIMYDKDKLRRSLYGKAGACRYKSYGVECRTFSNFWIKTPELTDWLFEQSEKAVEFVNSGNEIPLRWANKIIDCINNGDENLLKEIDFQYRVL